MERRDFLILSALATVLPTPAEGSPLAQDWKTAFDMKEGDEILGIALCLPGQALTEDEIAEHNGVLRYGRLPGASQLSQRAHKLSVLLNLEGLLHEAVPVFCGLILGGQALQSPQHGPMKRIDVEAFEAYIQQQVLLNKAHTAENAIATIDTSVGEIHIPKAHAALELKSQVEGLVLWRS